jgi:uncharacterized membrane protein (UPF0127 family)
MIASARVALLAAIVSVCVACSSSNPSGTTTVPAGSAATPVPTVIFGKTSITWIRDGVQVSMKVEVATAAAQSERGLGYRDLLPDDAGMLFDLHETRMPVFWMKGMRFPLDMVWIAEDRRVAAVTENVQPQPGVPDEQLRRISPQVAARYVLELNAGAAARRGIGAGTQLMFELPTEPSP